MVNISRTRQPTRFGAALQQHLPNRMIIMFIFGIVCLIYIGLSKRCPTESTKDHIQVIKDTETLFLNNDNNKNNNSLDSLIKDILPVNDYKFNLDILLKYPLKKVTCHLKSGDNTKPIIMHDSGGYIISWVCTNGGEIQVTKVMLHVFNEYYVASKDGNFQQKLMIDIGSNSGFYGILAATYGLKTIAFDLQPECIAVIQNSILVNNLVENMRVIPKGVSEEGINETTTKMLVPDQGCDGRFPVSAGNGGSKKVSVELNPLPYYLPDDKSLEIQMMKVDTEGNEKRVLAGALPLFASGKIKNAIVEVTPGHGFWSKAGITPEEMSTTLQTIIDDYKYAMIPLVATKGKNGRFALLSSHTYGAQSRSKILGEERLIFTNGKNATEYMLSESSPGQFDIWLVPAQDINKITKLV